MHPLADVGVLDASEFEPWSVCHVQFRIQVKDGWIKSEHRHFVGPADAKVADDQWGPWEVCGNQRFPEAHDPAN